jgi:hypothetical protein
MNEAIELLAKKWQGTRIVSTPYIPEFTPVLDENRNPTGKMGPHTLVFRGELFLHPNNYAKVMGAIDKLNLTNDIS